MNQQMIMVDTIILIFPTFLKYFAIWNSKWYIINNTEIIGLFFNSSSFIPLNGSEKTDDIQPNWLSKHSHKVVTRNKHPALSTYTGCFVRECFPNKNTNIICTRIATVTRDLPEYLINFRVHGFPFFLQKMQFQVCKRNLI